MVREKDVFKTCRQCNEGFKVLHGGVQIPQHKCERPLGEKNTQTVVGDKPALSSDGFEGKFKHGLD